MILSTTKCFFIGHKQFDLTEDVARMLRTEILRLIHSGVTEFYAGGSVGWDTCCAWLVLELKKVYPYIHLHLVLPCCGAIDSSKLTQRQLELYTDIHNRADSVEVVLHRSRETCGLDRFCRIMELANYCVCYYDRSRSGSLTAKVMKMAEEKDMLTANIFERSEEYRKGT